VKFKEVAVELARAKGEFVPLLEPPSGVFIESRLSRIGVDPCAAMEVRVDR
jgi:hypothetical protein